MIDALLYAVRDGIRKAGFNYDQATCEISEDGKPPPRCGEFFLSIHGGRSSPGPANQRNLDELYGFSVTLTMRVLVALDRLGDQQIARNTVLTDARKRGFHAKLDQLRSYLHSNWQITVQTGQTPNSANDNITAWTTSTVYGFVEPARYRGETIEKIVGGEWFSAEPDADDVGVTVEMQFDGARRMQPQTAGIGVFT